MLKWIKGGVLREHTIKNKVSYDEDLYSRQIAMIGKDAMNKLATSKILIQGMGGVGVEIAKNIVLAGIGAVSLVDTKKTSWEDFSTQFFLGEKDIGRNRAEDCKNQIQEPNPSVQVEVKDPLDSLDYSCFDAVVLTSSPISYSININNLCRERNITFIRTDQNGAFGSVFCDFGDGFTVKDVLGKEPKKDQIVAIAQGYPSYIYTVEDERLTVFKNNMVKISDVQGMRQLNMISPNKLKVLHREQNCIVLDIDSTSFDEYVGGGVITQYHPAETYQFVPLQDTLYDIDKFQCLGDITLAGKIPRVLHIGFLVLDKMLTDTKTEFSQQALNGIQKQKFLKTVDHINGLIKDDNYRIELDDYETQLLLEKLLHNIGENMCPTSAVLGGVAAQEVIKSITQKYRPIHQWFYLNLSEMLPFQQISENKTQHTSQINSDEMQKNKQALQHQLENLNVFLVGAGALGCELLKNFALMGIGCGENGKIIVTDDDTIERSNLSRQFLFREHHINQPKSLVAAQAAKKINPAIKIEALKVRVNEDTEHVFNDQFWKSVDLVVLALDSVQARTYVDEKCVQYTKAMLESGTEGPICTTKTVVPFLMDRYKDQESQDANSIPICTLRSFPYNINHCLAWAKSLFMDYFYQSPLLANSYQKDSSNMLHTAQADTSAVHHLELVYRVLFCKKYCTTFDSCILWAMQFFEDLFAKDIQLFKQNFPKGIVVEGIPFWSPPKRFPQEVIFNIDETLHVEFVQATSILLAIALQIPIPSYAHDEIQFLNQVFQLQDKTSKDVYVKSIAEHNGSEKQQGLSYDEDKVNQLRLKLDNLCVNNEASLMPIQFEKDDDTNYHMQFIVSAANLRARNYSIEQVEKLKAKVIVGQIIPSIVTTTAIAAGLVCSEVYKVIQQKQQIYYRDYWINLAGPNFYCTYASTPQVTEFNGEQWTFWDRWNVDQNITVQQLLDCLQIKGLHCYNIVWGNFSLFMVGDEDSKSKLESKVVDLILSMDSDSNEMCRAFFDIVCACQHGKRENKNKLLKDIIIPEIRINLC